MVVDPGEAKVVLEFLKAHQLILHTILLTHCHNDHIGGVSEIIECLRQANCESSWETIR